jgi:hypothetical protein
MLILWLLTPVNAVSQTGDDLPAGGGSELAGFTGANLGSGDCATGEESGQLSG